MSSPLVLKRDVHGQRWVGKLGRQLCQPCSQHCVLRVEIYFKKSVWALLDHGLDGARPRDGELDDRCARNALIRLPVLLNERHHPLDVIGTAEIRDVELHAGASRPSRRQTEALTTGACLRSCHSSTRLLLLLWLGLRTTTLRRDGVVRWLRWRRCDWCRLGRGGR